MSNIKIGDRFGLLVVTSITIGIHGGNIYNCRCDCGNEKSFHGWQLLGNKIHSCGCYLKTFRKLDGKTAAIRALYGAYKRNAENRGYEFSIPIENFVEVTSSNCYYCGAIPSMIKKPTHYDNREPERYYIHNGIDRLDNTKGYIKGNCVSCCSTCNMAKRTMTEEQFKLWIQKVYKNLYGNLAKKSVGELIDSLITIDIKCFMFQEKQLNSDLSDEDRLKFANIVLELNKKRNNAMRAIDFILGFDTESVTPKTYMENLDKDDIKPEF